MTAKEIIRWLENYHSKKSRNKNISKTYATCKNYCPKRISLAFLSSKPTGHIKSFASGDSYQVRIFIIKSSRNRHHILNMTTHNQNHNQPVIWSKIYHQQNKCKPNVNNDNNCKPKTNWTRAYNTSRRPGIKVSC